MDDDFLKIEINDIILKRNNSTQTMVFSKHFFLDYNTIMFTYFLLGFFFINKLKLFCVFIKHYIFVVINFPISMLYLFASDCTFL